MEPDDSVTPPNASELNELRLRIDRLELEVAALLQHQTSPIAQPQHDAPLRDAPPLPPVIAAVPSAKPFPVLSTMHHMPPPPPARPGAPKASLENRLGSQIFNRIAIVALLIGMTLFLKLAIDNHWIGPLGRILIGLIAGAGLILWSEHFRRQRIQAFSYSLKAVGSGALYLSLWAAFQLYHLLPAPIALGAMLLVTAWNAYMAWSQDAELLAAYALIGGFATPALLSTGGNHEIFLFTYLLAINLATALLIRLKNWPRLILGIFPATVVYFIDWYSSNYAPAALGITSIFLILFGLTFVSISIGSPIAVETQPATRRSFRAVLAGILLPLANAAFVSLGFYFMLDNAAHHAALPWLMLILAAAYLGIMRLPQRRVAAALHLSLAVVFLTIAVPLKASGHWITVAWLVEGVALYWVATRLANTEPSTDSSDELRDDTVLRCLSIAALLLGFIAVFVSSYWFDAALRPGFFNHDLATALIGIVAFATVAWLSWKNSKGNTRLILLSALIAIDILALLLTEREIGASHTIAYARGAFLNADFATALIGIATLAAVAYAARNLSRIRQRTQTWVLLAGASIVALNLVAILSGVVEITALWSGAADTANAALKQALAVSAFLMAYSALLLAIGFWKRNAFIRWQGLALLVFTIAKTFVYDTSSLSQGYRVVSFLALGVLLMAVSFAYQKDWLSLREPTPPAPEEDPQP
jgi:uncharacterized membrane protein